MAFEIKSKFGVSPFIIHPIAITPSYFLIIFDIATGISKAPGTDIESNFFIFTAFNSATAALHAAVVAVGVQPGEEVVVPPYTFTSTATSSLMHNAIPVFSDVKRDIFCIDPSKLENVHSKLTRAIIPVHLFGHASDMDEIMTFAKKNNLRVI